MDSLTQIVLGAACGEAVLGKKVGNKAILWGAIAGTIPDLDVFLSPLFHPVDALFVHRGFSHSLLFSFLIAPLLGGLIFKIYKGKYASYRDWSLLVFVSVFTHPLLDAFTGYGTPLFMPFSDYRVDINSIFIIDPLYTLPFLFCVIMVMRAKKDLAKRKKWNRRGLVLSTSYLLLTFVHQQWMEYKFESSLNEQNLSYTRTKTFPTPFNALMYGFLAETDTCYYMAYRSIFDSDKPMEFSCFPAHHDYIEPWKDDDKIKKLIRFSKGFYTVQKEGDSYLLYDMRFGQAGGWDDPNAPFVFSMTLLPQKDGSVRVEKSDWRKARMSGMSSLLKRISGK